MVEEIEGEVDQGKGKVNGRAEYEKEEVVKNEEWELVLDEEQVLADDRQCPRDSANGVVVPNLFPLP